MENLKKLLFGLNWKLIILYRQWLRKWNYNKKRIERKLVNELQYFCFSCEKCFIEGHGHGNTNCISVSTFSSTKIIMKTKTQIVPGYRVLRRVEKKRVFFLRINIRACSRTYSKSPANIAIFVECCRIRMPQFDMCSCITIFHYLLIVLSYKIRYREIQSLLVVIGPNEKRKRLFRANDCRS